MAAFTIEFVIFECSLCGKEQLTWAQEYYNVELPVGWTVLNNQDPPYANRCHYCPKCSEVFDN